MNCDIIAQYLIQASEYWAWRLVKWTDLSSAHVQARERLLGTHTLGDMSLKVS
jgi:hypothetical protein